MATDNFDMFEYYGFEMSYTDIKRQFLRTTSRNAKRSIFSRPMYELDSPRTFLQCIICAIANNEATFNHDNKKLCRLLQQVIVESCYDDNGVYIPEAHIAMRNLCQIQNQNPNDYILYDKNLAGKMAQAKAKFKTFFGRTKHETPAPMQATAEPRPVISEAATKKLNDINRQIAKIANTPNSAEKIKKLRQERNTILNKYGMRGAQTTQPAQPQPTKPQPQPAKVQPAKAAPIKPQPAPAQQKSKNKNRLLYRMTAAFTGIVALGLGIASMTSDTNTATEKNQKNDTAKPTTFKTVSSQATSHATGRTYDMADYYRSQEKANQSKPAPAPQPAVASQLTRTSKSALNILLGAQKADDLCRRVQSQINAGIFSAPDGMSVEQIAHAMTMSRIYEGKSIILDALQSNVKLTDAQQAKFNKHIIDEIGDMGVKIQKRTSEKTKLSSHSKFDNAPKSLQQEHIRNLQKLNEMKTASHTR